MRVIAKQISKNVKTVNGWIVYVMDNTDRPIEADICDFIDLKEVIEIFKLKYNL